jgi:hypothetical protein
LPDEHLVMVREHIVAHLHRVEAARRRGRREKGRTSSCVRSQS